MFENPNKMTCNRAYLKAQVQEAKVAKPSGRLEPDLSVGLHISPSRGTRSREKAQGTSSAIEGTCMMYCNKLQGETLNSSAFRALRFLQDTGRVKDDLTSEMGLLGQWGKQCCQSGISSTPLQVARLGVPSTWKI